MFHLVPVFPDCQIGPKPRPNTRTVDRISDPSPSYLLRELHVFTASPFHSNHLDSLPIADQRDRTLRGGLVLPSKRKGKQLHNPGFLGGGSQQQSIESELFIPTPTCLVSSSASIHPPRNPGWCSLFSCVDDLCDLLVYRPIGSLSASYGSEQFGVNPKPRNLFPGLAVLLGKASGSCQTVHIRSIS